MADETEVKPRPVSGRRLLSPKWGVGPWMWDSTTSDKQICRFWRSFEIPRNLEVERAWLRVAVDNGYRVFLDGRELGRGSEWRIVTEYDLTWWLSPGKHVLALEAFNDDQNAGAALGLRVEFADGQTMELPSGDDGWRIVTGEVRQWEQMRQAPAHWRKITIVGPMKMSNEFWVQKWKGMRTVTRVPPVMPVEPRFWQTVWFQIVVMSVCVVVLMVCLWLAAKLAVQSKAQKMLGRERARIARDIHDDLGSGLTRLVVLGELMQNEMPLESPQRTHAEQLCTSVREQLRTIDDVIWAVNSRRDTLRDFVMHVAKHAGAYFENTPVRCRLDFETDLPEISFPLPVRRNLFLAVKEALHNTAKHSEATEMFLRIHRMGENLQVVVEDNGRGFDPEKGRPERDGMTNMQTRMAEIGGACKVISQPGQGCRIEFSVALGAKPSRWLRRAGARAEASANGQPAQKYGNQIREFLSS